jgi:hypothetical protein
MDMNWGNRAKIVVGIIWAVMNVVFVAGCEEKNQNRSQIEEPAKLESGTSALLRADNNQRTANLTPDNNIPGSAPGSRINVRDLREASKGKQIDDKAELEGITADTQFSRAIDIVRNSTRPPINIVVLWNDLRDKAGIEMQTPIGVDAVKGISIRKNLEIILRSLSTREIKIDYAVVDGVVVIGTKDSLPKNMKLRTYDITDLTGKPADYSTSNQK